MELFGGLLVFVAAVVGGLAVEDRNHFLLWVSQILLIAGVIVVIYSTLS